MDDREDLKEFASRVGRDLTDGELEEYFTAPENTELPCVDGSVETDDEIQNQGAPVPGENSES